MGMPYASREVRWFVDHTVDNSAILKDWIEQKDPFDKDGHFLKAGIWKGRLDEKPDVYALVSGADDIGIKWREGELQIKGRRENIGVQSFEGGARGYVEQWLKWSYNSPDIRAAFLPWFDPDAERGPRIIPATKTRALRKIHVDGLGKLAEVSVDAFPDRAVNVELTELKVFDKSYWSIGVEAFPDDSNMAAAFYEVTSQFLSQLRDVQLDTGNSQSYPVWLSQICAGAVGAEFDIQNTSFKPN